MYKQLQEKHIIFVMDEIDAKLDTDRSLLSAFVDLVDSVGTFHYRFVGDGVLIGIPVNDNGNELLQILRRVIYTTQSVFGNRSGKFGNELGIRLSCTKGEYSWGRSVLQNERPIMLGSDMIRLSRLDLAHNISLKSNPSKSPISIAVNDNISKLIDDIGYEHRSYREFSVEAKDEIVNFHRLDL